jgi:hypothetical protein
MAIKAKYLLGKLERAQAVASRCREIDVDPPEWVRHQLAKKAKT